MLTTGEFRKDASRFVRMRTLRILDHAFRQSRATLGAKRVLLECSNALMFGYVLRAWTTISGDGGLEGYVTRFSGRTPRLDEQAAAAGLRWVSSGRAVATPWDLVIFAEHAPLKYAPAVPKVILPHGPGPSRSVRDGSYYYDRRRALWPDGRPVYELMLDTSAYASARALEWLPEYKGKLRVAGDLVADQLVLESRVPHRDRGTTRIAVMSTWGPHGLVPRHSDWLFPSLLELAGQRSHEFVVTMHQNLWDARRAGTSRWRDTLTALEGPGVRVVRPDEDWTTLLSRTDLAITDHTSLSALYSVLGKPIIPVTVGDVVLTERTFSAWMYENRTPIAGLAELRDALAHPSRYSLDGAPKVVDCVGRSHDLTAAALREVLWGPRSATAVDVTN